MRHTTQNRNNPIHKQNTRKKLAQQAKQRKREAR